jgi:hypothetical protein
MGVKGPSVGHVIILGRINSRRLGYTYYFRLHGELPKPCPSDKCGTLREALIPMRQKCRFCKDPYFSAGSDTGLGVYENLYRRYAPMKEAVRKKRRRKLAYKRRRFNFNAGKWK